MSWSICDQQGNYEIVCKHGEHDGEWIVIRQRDGKIMMTSPRVKECLRWVATWGSTNLGR